MKIYTRKGDGGRTGILGGGRLVKADARIRALGCLDELNAVLGAALAEPGLPEPLRPLLTRIQGMLFEAGAALASTDPATSAGLFRRETEWLEQEIDRQDAALPPLRNFILPGGDASAARLHWARTIARRAESQVVEALEALSETERRHELLSWLNRLSDALFVFARTANLLRGTEELPWHPEQGRRSAKPAGESGEKSGERSGEKPGKHPGGSAPGPEDGTISS